MNDFERNAVKAALDRMLCPERWLDICVIDQIIKVGKIVPPAREYEAVRLLHCVSWREMNTELRDSTVQILLGWFGLPAFNPFEQVEQIVQPRRRLFRLFGE